MAKTRDGRVGKLKNRIRRFIQAAVIVVVTTGVTLGILKLTPLGEKVGLYKEPASATASSNPDSSAESILNNYRMSGDKKVVASNKTVEVETVKTEETETEEEEEEKKKETVEEDKVENEEKQEILGGGDGPKVVNVTEQVEERQTHTDVVNGEVVGTTETTTTVYADENGEQYISVNATVTDGNGDVLSEKTIIADPNGKIVDDTTLSVEQENGDFSLVTGSAVEENTSNVGVVGNTVEGIAQNPLDEFGPTYSNFLFKTTSANGNTEEETMLKTAVLNNLPQMPIEVQEAINDKDTTITFETVKPVDFELGGQVLINPAEQSTIVVPTIRMNFNNMKTGNIVGSISVKAGLVVGDKQQSFKPFAGGEIVGSIILDKWSISGGIGVDGNQNAKIAISFFRSLGTNAKAHINETSTNVIGAVRRSVERSQPGNGGNNVDNRTDAQKLFDQIKENEEANLPTVEQDMQDGHVEQHKMANLNYGDMTYEGNTETMAEQINNYAPIPEAPAQGDANTPGNNPLAEGNDVNLNHNTNMGGLTWGD